MIPSSSLKLETDDTAHTFALHRLNLGAGRKGSLRVLELVHDSTS